jgi:hypothetical protein
MVHASVLHSTTGKGAIASWQAVDSVHQIRSHIAQILNGHPAPSPLGGAPLTRASTFLSYTFREQEDVDHPLHFCHAGVL